MHARVALATAAVVALLWLAICGYLVQKHRTDLEAAALESRSLAHGFEENIRRTVETIDTAIRALRLARAHDPAHFDIGAWVRDSGLTRGLTLQISIADRLGAVTASTLGAGHHPVSIADRDHFRLVRDQVSDELFISRAVIGRVSGQWSVQFVRRLADAGGAFDGVIIASLDPAFLSRFYNSLDSGRRALVLSGQDGFVRAVAPATVAGLDADLSRTPLMTGVADRREGTTEMINTADRVDRIYSWRRVDPYGLVVAVGLPRGDVLAEYRSHLRGCVAIGVGLTIVTLLMGLAHAHNRRDFMQSQELLRAAVDNIGQGLLVVDAQRRVPLLNARAAELLGLPEELTKPGFAFDDLLTWQIDAGEFDGPDLERVRNFVLSGGIKLGESVYRRTRLNGTVLEVRTKALETGLAVRTFTDVTEQEQTARILADARDAAEAAASVRAEFLAVMSHEIRTPLNGVIGMAELLEAFELEPAQREYVRLIRQSGDHLLWLINRILDFSRLEADRVQLEETNFDPVVLVQEIEGMFQSQASAKGLHLSAIVSEAVPRAVTGDPGRLRQVVLNLVSNAVKFTDQGWVSLNLTHEPAADGYVRLLFSVADSGIGIAHEVVEQMFQAFTQMDGSISRRFGGSGLGLAICRRLVELMGGTITVESQPGSGSTFRFDVTLKQVSCPPAVVPAEATQAAESGLRILLAEDNPTNRLVALRMLERLGHRADAVSTGKDVIAALAVARYDLILMDVMMPEVDGLSATRQIRAAEKPDGRIAIVGLTAGSSAANLAACMEAGMDCVTTKPITLARLRAAIAEGRAKSGERPRAENQDGTTPRLRALAEALGEAAVAEIIDAFTEDTRANLEAMRAAAARDDASTIYHCAHSVAGAARNVGAHGLAERASALEATAGSLSAGRIETEIAAMQADLDTMLDGLAGGVGVMG